MSVIIITLSKKEVKQSSMNGAFLMELFKVEDGISEFPVKFQLQRPWSQIADSKSQTHLTNPELKIQDG